MNTNSKLTMEFSIKQRGVLHGMLTGAAISIGLIIFGILLNPFNFQSNLTLLEKSSVLFKSLILLALCLAFSIGRLAKHRFFNPDEIDGRGLRTDSDRAIFLQSLLQNTLEQSVLAAFVYGTWTFVMPSAWLSVVPLAALSFALGRVLFFAGYRRGAVGRAVGFTMAFYPSVLMLICTVFVLTLSAVAGDS